MKDDTIKHIANISGLCVLTITALVTGHNGVILGMAFGILGTYAGIKRDKKE